MAKDILLDENNEPLVVDGDFVIGESEDQEIRLLLRLNQGEVKRDPVIGPNLVQEIEQGLDEQKIMKKVRLHLERDGKDFNEYKNKIVVK